MAALLALVATTVLTTLLLFIDTATGAVTQFFVSPLLLIGIPWPVCNLALLSAVYALFAFLLENATATTRLLTADGRPNGKLDEILWLDRTLRHDYGRWPLALAVVIASVSLLTAPGVFAGVAPAWAWALYILTGVTAVRVYHDREKLRNAPTVRPPVVAQLVDNDVRLAPQQVIECLRMSARYRGQLRVLRSSSSRPRAEFPLTGNESWAREFMPDGLLSHVLGSLEISGVKALYPHQLGALQEVLSDPVDGTRSHVILATGPGSGRRLTAFLATLERTLRRGANVLVITPDEEVLQRERARFRALAERTDWLYALHEGVIPPEWDGRVPDPPYEILHCSIDTLHSTLLKDNRAWAQFFAELELVIVHDLDRYAGVVGANATQVFRRLQLLATSHGQRIQYLTTSRPAAQLVSFASELLSLTAPVDTVHTFDADGSPRPERVFTVWLPALDRPVGSLPGARLTQQLVRQRPFDAALDVLAVLCALPDFRVLLYCGGLEQIEEQALTEALFRQIGRPLPTTHLRVARDEVELGGRQIDYDGLVILGNPAHLQEIERLTGQLGGARKGGLTIVLATHAPAALSLIRTLQPERSIEESPLESMLPLDGQHRAIVEKHLACALTEMALSQEDVGRTFGELGVRTTEYWLQRNLLVLEPNHLLGPRTTRRLLPVEDFSATVHARTSLETVNTNDRVLKVSTPTGQLVLRVDCARTACEAYPHREVLRGRQPYLVVLQQGDPIAVTPTSDYHGSGVPLFRYAAAVPANHSSDARRPTYIGAGAPIRIARCSVHVTQELRAVCTVAASRLTEDGTVVEVRPAQTASFVTDAILISAAPGPPALSPLIAHSLAHLFHNSLMTNLPPDIGRTHLEVAAVDMVGSYCEGPCVVIYDNFDEGMGIAEILSNQVHRLLQDAYRTLAACPCRDGCPACLQDPACRHDRDRALCTTIDKRSTMQFLGAILGPIAERITGWKPAELDRMRYEVVDRSEDLARIRRGVFELGLFPVVSIAEKDEYMPAAVRFMTRTERDEMGGVPLFFRVSAVAGPEIVVRQAKEQDLVSYMAHAYAHDWQHWVGSDGQPFMHPSLRDRTNVPFDGRLFAEGFAQWLELRVLDGYGFMKTTEHVDFLMFDDYGEGYQIVKYLEDEHGVNGVLEFLHRDNSRDDIIKVIRAAGVETRINNLMLRLADGAAILPPDDVVVEATSHSSTPAQYSGSDDLSVALAEPHELASTANTQGRAMEHAVDTEPGAEIEDIPIHESDNSPSAATSDAQEPRPADVVYESIAVDSDEPDRPGEPLVSDGHSSEHGSAAEKPPNGAAQRSLSNTDRRSTRRRRRR